MARAGKAYRMPCVEELQSYIHPRSRALSELPESEEVHGMGRTKQMGQHLVRAPRAGGVPVGGRVFSIAYCG